MSNLTQRLYRAVDALIGSGPIQKRLAYAKLDLIVLDTSFDAQRSDPETFGELQALVSLLTEHTVQDGDYGRVEMDDHDAQKAAERIFALFVKDRGGLG